MFSFEDFLRRAESRLLPAPPEGWRNSDDDLNARARLIPEGQPRKEAAVLVPIVAPARVAWAQQAAEAPPVTTSTRLTRPFGIELTSTPVKPFDSEALITRWPSSSTRVRLGPMRRRLSVLWPPVPTVMLTLVDVMLVLLIIFLITIPVVTTSIKVDLPHETQQPIEPKPDNVILSVDHERYTPLSSRSAMVNSS